MQYSVVNYKTVKENSDSFRYDAEYFQIQPLLTKISDSRNVKLQIISDWITQGPNPKFNEDGIFCLTGRNISTGELAFEGSDLVDEAEFRKWKRFLLLNGDILITLKGAGSTGKVAIFYSDQKSIFSRNLGLIRLAKQKLTPEFLLAFFNSRLGQKIIDRGVTGGTGQLTLPTTYIKNLRIPDFNTTFIKKITTLVLDHQYSFDNSKSLYSQAEQLLLSELGLLDWEPKHKLAFVKNFSHTQNADRFDAEYFQPKYEEIIEAVKKFKGGFDELGNLVKIKDKNFTPKDNEQYKYVELANISSNGEINGYTENFGNELPSRARRKVQKGDLIVSSIEGSLESIALITEDWKNVLCSTGFFAVNSDKINSETLLVLLKTKVGQLQLKKGCKGTILTAIGKEELSKIVLPKIDSKTQEEIKKKIAEMYETKKLSKSILEIAKRGVEMAIEENEEAAEKWIQSELKILKI